MLSPKEYVAALCVPLDAQDWYEADLLKYETCQPFASARDWVSLTQFFADVLDLAETRKARERVHNCLNDLVQLRKDMDCAFKAAVAKADAIPSVRAIYFEYDLGGGDESTGDFFVCERYSTDTSDDWPASFRIGGDRSAGIIGGPNIYSYFNFDPDFEFSNFDSSLAEAYGFATLLRVLGETIDRNEYRRLPVGFAQHDSSSVIHIVP